MLSRIILINQHQSGFFYKYIAFILKSQLHNCIINKLLFILKVYVKTLYDI